MSLIQHRAGKDGEGKGNAKKKREKHQVEAVERTILLLFQLLVLSFQLLLLFLPKQVVNAVLRSWTIKVSLSCAVEIEKNFFLSLLTVRGSLFYL